MNLTRRVLAFVRPYRGRLLAALACMAAFSALSGASIVTITPIIDSALNKQPLAALERFAKVEPPAGEGALERAKHAVALRLHEAREYLRHSPWRVLKFTAILLVGLVVLRGLANYAQGYLMAWVEQRTVADLRGALFERVQHLSLDFFDARRTGHTMALFASDMQALQSAITALLRDVPLQGMQIAVFAGIALWVDWRLIGFGLVVVGVVMGPIVFIGRKLRRVSHAAQEAQAEMTGILQEAIAGIRIVKAFSMEPHELRKYVAQVGAYFAASMRSARAAAWQEPIVEIMGTVGAAAFILYGGDRVIKGHLSFGTFFLFLIAISMTLKPIKRLSSVYGAVQAATAAGERIFGALDAVPSVSERPGSVAAAPLHQTVRFEAVRFAYAKGSEVLAGLDLEVRAGEVVALVGPSGAGKTTLVNLIPRFYDVTGGRILLDGRDVRDLTVRSLRRQIGIVSQDPFLFHDSVADNIRYGRPEATDSEVHAAARTAHADEFVRAFPYGYDTIVGERGLRVSGGQRQRLTIARALLRNPSILILDEATSSLDSESERLVQDALETLMRGRTTFVVAHRLSTVQRADRIVVLEGGRIGDVGTHAELFARGGLYRRLYETQFQGMPVEA